MTTNLNYLDDIPIIDVGIGTVKTVRLYVNCQKSDRYRSHGDGYQW